MSSREPARLSERDTREAALLEAYAARTHSHLDDDDRAWQRLQPALAARLCWRRPWAQARVLAGAFTVALGLFVLARSAMLLPGRDAAAARPATDGEGPPGGGGSSGALDGDSRGAGGMEGASGGAGRAVDGV